jgi:nitrous oxide reductase accessory protein NosL
MRQTGIVALLIAAAVCLAAVAPPPEDIRRHPECKYCGMDREKFGYSRMLVRYADGTVMPSCSIHCTGIDLALNPHKGVEASLVGDYDTRVLLDAEKAFWVLGGDRMGVMSIRGKWAFGERRAAERFIKEHGGALATYDEAMKAAFEDMYEILRPLCETCPSRPQPAPPPHSGR